MTPRPGGDPVTAPEAATPRRRRTVLGCILAAAVTVLDLSLTSTALGAMLQGVGAPLDEGALVVSASATAEIVTLALSAYLTRVVPPRAYLGGLVLLFAAGSLLTACSWDLTSLLGARVVQGAAAGAIMPFAYYAIVVLLPRAEHPRAISVFSLTVTATYVLGPALSVTVGEWFGWRALFVVALPAGLVALALALPGLREVTPPEGDRGRGLSATSVVSVVVGLFLLQYVLDRAGDTGLAAPAVLAALGAAALAALAVFVANELRTRHPLVDLRLLRPSPFLASCLYNAVAGAAVYASYFLIPFALTDLGFSVGDIGAVSVVGAAVQLGVAFWLPLLLRRVEVHLLALTGTAVLALGAVTPLVAGPDPAWGAVVTALTGRAVGAGLLLAALGLMVTRTLAPQQAPSGSLLFNMSRSIGGALGTALCATFLVLREAAHVAAGDPDPRSLALTELFTVATGVLALLAAALLVGRVRRTGRATPSPRPAPGS